MASKLNVVVCAPSVGDLDPVRAIDPSLNVIDGNAVFEEVHRARRDGVAAEIAAAEAAMNALLAQADVLCMSFPMLQEVVVHAPRLRWLHHTQAGVSNLWISDVWNAESLIITSGRAYMRPTAIAEYAIAGALAFGRGIYDGFLDVQNGRLDRGHYQLIRTAGASMGVIGYGGIGGEVGRLAKALGMRVIGTRRSVTEPIENTDGADLMLPSSQQDRLAAESDYIAVCAQLTKETHHLLGERFFAAVTKKPVLINVARGEVIDEDAMIAALRDGRLGGAVLDVYEGEMDRKPPRPELLAAPRVVLTPHISGGGASSETTIRDLFCENLRRYLRGEELLNLVDRERGY
jgi:phosphoglycerate dehydrogenase-like enzyme